MYLKSLEINGFKSFSKKTNLEFKTKISSIVGPNGSGKSNVAESFRFVLGEQSMKNMRGKKGEDLIFRGKNNRLNRGAVKVIFDNSDKTLNIDYDEVIIERVVYRDGTNEYSINGSKVRAKDVLELLTSANIGASGHHIISQGEADKILSISPKERKAVIEEALGLKSYVIKKTESERKLAKTEENLKEIKTRERVNAPRIKFLKREVEKIEKSKEMKEELSRLYFAFFPNKVKIENKISEISQKISEKENEKKQAEEKIFAKREELKKSKSSNTDDAQRNSDIEKIQFEITQIENQKSELQKDLARNEIQIESELSKKADFEEQKEKVEENLKIYNEKLSSIKNIFFKKFADYFSDKSEIVEEISKDILSFFGIEKSGVSKENFDLDLVAEKKEENASLEKRIQSINELLESLSKKIRILNSNTEDAGEVLSQEIEIEILKMEKVLSGLISEISNLNREKMVLDGQLDTYRKEESFAISFFGLDALEKFYNADEISEEKNILEKIIRTRILLENAPTGNSEEILEEYKILTERQEFISKEITDLETTKGDLIKLIEDISNQIEVKFRSGVEKINKEFSVFFSTLFSGGRAEINLVNVPIRKTDEDDIQEFELGIDMKVSLPNKKISGLSMLSGGERSLTSIALLFAMSSINPPPFIILDETDAALDEANSKRYGDMIEKLAEHSQLILITHNRETMSRAGLLYGVTMADEGSSKLLSVSLEEGIQYAK